MTLFVGHLPTPPFRFLCRPRGEDWQVPRTIGYRAASSVCYLFINLLADIRKPVRFLTSSASLHVWKNRSCETAQKKDPIH